MATGRSAVRLLAHRQFDDSSIHLTEVSILDGDHVRCEEWHDICHRITPPDLSMRGAIDNAAPAPLGMTNFYPAGSRLMFECNEMEAIRPKLIFCRFGDRWAEHFFGQPLDFRDVNRERCINITNASLLFGLNRIVEELRNPGFASEALIESLLNFAITEIYRALHSDFVMEDRSTRLSDRQMKQVNELVMNWDDAPLRAQRVADQLHMSASHFQHLFKRSTGQSFHQYVSRTRAEMAKQLLTETYQPLKQIAHRLGFSSTSSFSVAFSKEVGCSPGIYRRQRLQ